MVSITGASVRSEIARQTTLSKAIARAQSDVSSNTRLQVASDDPVASARVATIRRTQANETQWNTNAQSGAATAQQADTGLGAVQTSLDRAKELMLRASSDTLSDDDRASIGTELTGIREDIAAQANAKDANGRALFSEGTPLALPIGDGVTATTAPSRADAFGDLDSVLGNAIESLGLADPDARQSATATSLDAIDAASSHLSDVRGAQGLRMQRLDAATERFATSAVQLEEEKGNLSATDVSQAVAFIQQSLTQLSAAQTTFARVSQQTLFSVLG